jgi:hypothetical protein
MNYEILRRGIIITHHSYLTTYLFSKGTEVQRFKSDRRSVQSTNNEAIKSRILSQKESSYTQIIDV